MARKSKPRLGRGLSSLLATPVAVTPTPEAPEAPETPDAQPADADRQTPEDPTKTHPQQGGPPAPVPAPTSDAAPTLTYLQVQRVHPNPYQPRDEIDLFSIESLADSIKQDGLMQPIVVRPNPDNDTYQLVAGERRWRAAQTAGLDTLPAIVRTLSDRELAEWALIENVQREDLNPIEQARAYRQLIDQFGLHHDDVAQRIGIDRVTVTNALRLLDLDADIQSAIAEQRLSAGHGRALLGLSDLPSRAALAKRAIAGGWSVRMVEAAVRRITQPAAATSPGSGGGVRSAHIADLEEQIAAQLQTKVAIKTGRRRGTGTLCIDFYSLDQFDSFIEKLGVKVD